MEENIHEPDNLADSEQIPEILDSKISEKTWKHLKIINERFSSRWQRDFLVDLK